jgi:arginyl-tRNA synthetase
MPKKRTRRKAKKRPRKKAHTKAHKTHPKAHKVSHAGVSRKAHRKLHKRRPAAKRVLHRKFSRKKAHKTRKHLRPRRKIRRHAARKHAIARKHPRPVRRHSHTKVMPKAAKKKEGVKKTEGDKSRLRAKVRPSIQPRDFLKDIKSQIAEAVSSASGLRPEEIIPLLERPPEGIEADFAVPCFVLAKQLRKNPHQIAQEISGKIPPLGVIREAKQAGPYVNFIIDWKNVAQEAIPHILSNPGYGSSELGRGRTIVIDFSHPNVAKPMSIGHLRSTIIGDSLSRVYSTLGYKVIGDNHLGDWGTQFGKIIIGYRKWGKPEKLQENPIEELLRVYVKFHEEAEIDSRLEDEARAAFKKLEDGDKESLALWKKFSDLSLKEFGKIYRELGVKFDTCLGESFYLKSAREIVDDALKRGVAKWSEHAVVIDTGHEIPLIIRKSDEATLYSTRDLATIKHRLRAYKPDKILYVVGSEQKSYFEQVFIAAEKLGYITPEQKKSLVHVSFGMVSLPEGKMSTRKGRVVFLEHVIEEVTKMAEKTIEAKNPELKNREQIAKQVGIGAIKYADLSRDRIKDIRFDWSEMLSFEGDTGPYIQYTHARACSILRKGNFGKKASLDAFQQKVAKSKIDTSLLSDPKEKAMVRKLCEFPETIMRASQDNKPHYIASYVFSLATLFNEFYQSVPVLRAEGSLRSARLALVMAAKEVLKKGLYLLGIEAPEEM